MDQKQNLDSVDAKKMQGMLFSLVFEAYFVDQKSYSTNLNKAFEEHSKLTLAQDCIDKNLDSKTKKLFIDAYKNVEKAFQTIIRLIRNLIQALPSLWKR